MTDNVIPLRADDARALSRSDAMSPPVMQPCDVTISTLEDLLAQARTGEIIGVVAATQHHDNLSSYRVSGLVGSYSILGAIDHAKIYVIAAQDGQS